MNIGVHATLHVSIRTSSSDGTTKTVHDVTSPPNQQPQPLSSPPVHRRRRLVRFVSVAVDARRKHRARRVSSSTGLRSSAAEHADRHTPGQRGPLAEALRGPVVVDARSARCCLIVRTLTDTPPQRARRTRRQHVKFDVFDWGVHLVPSRRESTVPIVRICSSRFADLSSETSAPSAYRSTIACRYTNLAQMENERTNDRYITARQPTNH